MLSGLFKFADETLSDDLTGFSRSLVCRSELNFLAGYGHGHDYENFTEPFTTPIQ